MSNKSTRELFAEWARNRIPSRTCAVMPEEHGEPETRDLFAECIKDHSEEVPTYYSTTDDPAEQFAMFAENIMPHIGHLPTAKERK